MFRGELQVTRHVIEMGDCQISLLDRGDMYAMPPDDDIAHAALASFMMPGFSLWLSLSAASALAAKCLVLPVTFLFLGHDFFSSPSVTSFSIFSPSVVKSSLLKKRLLVKLMIRGATILKVNDGTHRQGLMLTQRAFAPTLFRLYYILMRGIFQPLNFIPIISLLNYAFPMPRHWQYGPNFHHHILRVDEFAAHFGQFTYMSKNADTINFSRLSLLSPRIFHLHFFHYDYDAAWAFASPLTSGTLHRQTAVDARASSMSYLFHATVRCLTFQLPLFLYTGSTLHRTTTHTRSVFCFQSLHFSLHTQYKTYNWELE